MIEFLYKIFFKQIFWYFKEKYFILSKYNLKNFEDLKRFNFFLVNSKIGINISQTHNFK